MKMKKKEYNKYYHDYIEGVNLDNIEFKTFTYDELLEFLKQNYYDEEFDKAVYWEPDGFVSPFGMYYMEFVASSEEYNYLLGLVNNSKGGKTIAFCMVYDDDFGPRNEIENRYGYLSTIETNYFFRNMGVLNMALEHLKETFKNNNILVISPESVQGSRVRVFEKIKTFLNDTIEVISEEEYFDSLAKRQKW